MKQLLLATLLLCGLAACQKKSDPSTDPASVTMTITSPAEGQLYHSGDTVMIHAEVRSPGEMHGYEVSITDSATGAVVLDSDQHLHSDYFSIDQTFVPPAATSAVYRLKLEAELDHNGTEAEKTVRFRLEP